MPPIWPFKKKKEMEHEIDEAPPAPVVYKRGEDPNARAAVEADAGAYKDALALFGDGSSKVNAATDQSVHYDGVTASSNDGAPAQNVNSGRPDGSSSEEKSTDVEAVGKTGPGAEPLISGGAPAAEALDEDEPVESTEESAIEEDHQPEDAGDAEGAPTLKLPLQLKSGGGQQ